MNDANKHKLLQRLEKPEAIATLTAQEQAIIKACSAIA